jgi:hypothetical protein
VPPRPLTSNLQYRRVVLASCWLIA